MGGLILTKPFSLPVENYVVQRSLSFWNISGTWASYVKDDNNHPAWFWKGDPSVAQAVYNVPLYILGSMKYLHCYVRGMRNNNCWVRLYDWNTNAVLINQSGKTVDNNWIHLDINVSGLINRQVKLGVYALSSGSFAQFGVDDIYFSDNNDMVIS